MSSVRLDVKQAAEGQKELALRRLFDATRKDLTHLRKSIFNTGGLAITGAGTTTAKTVNTIQAMSDGVFFAKAAANMAALSGTVTNGAFNMFVFTVTTGGTLATHMGVEGAALINVVAPAIPLDEVVIGYVTINPTGTGDFVGGTDDLDDATIVPNAVYVNTVLPFDVRTANSLEA